VANVSLLGCLHVLLDMLYCSGDAYVGFIANISKAPQPAKVVDDQRGTESGGPFRS